MGRVCCKEKDMIIDISQEVFTCNVFPGDPSPEMDMTMQISKGDICNLTYFKMCAHNGTHIDAPFHFINDGKTVDEIAPEHFVGECYVARHTGDVSADDAKAVLARAADAGADKRILIAGRATVTADAAKVFADAGILLIGNESQTVGSEDAPKEVHMILLSKEVVLLEGIRLDGVEEGRYFLSAMPVNLGGCDGAPCRAILIK